MNRVLLVLVGEGGGGSDWGSPARLSVTRPTPLREVSPKGILGQRTYRRADWQICPRTPSDSPPDEAYVQLQ